MCHATSGRTILRLQLARTAHRLTDLMLRLGVFAPGTQLLYTANAHADIFWKSSVQPLCKRLTSCHNLSFPVAATLMLLIAAAASSPGTALAVTKNWTLGSGDWVPGNWSPAGVPLTSDFVNVVFADGVARTVNYNYSGSIQKYGQINLDLTGGSAAAASTLTMYGNNFNSQSEWIGVNGSGIFDQYAGTNTLIAGTGFLDVGVYPGSMGTYTLSSAALVGNTPEYIGDVGTGIFNHTGGTNTISGAGNSLYLGYNFAGTSGTYILSSGALSVGTAEYVGYGSTGFFKHTGGTNTITSQLYVGNNIASTGTYTLGGTGALSAASEYVGFSGTGVFNQTSGANTLTSDLTLGANAGSTGTYSLSGTGTLSCTNEFIGSAGAAAFNQSGGTNNVTGNISIGPAGILTLSGGTLNTGSISNSGTFLFSGGTLGITGASGLAIGSGGPFGSTLDLGSSMTVNVTFGSTNQGLVSGDGQIGGTFANTASGELRAEPGKSLKLTGANNTNAGRINLLGGELEYTQNLTNSVGALISGNGTLITHTGMVNQGTMNFGGTTNILGDVTNALSGKIISGGGGATIFLDDVANQGEIRTSANGFTVFYGTVSGAGTFTGTGTVNFEGDLTPGNSPAAVNFGGNVSLGPDSILHIEIGGTTAGTQYDQVNVAGALSLGGTLQVSFIKGFTPAAGATFDFLNWGNLAGAFSSIQLPALSGLMWNTSQLASGVLSVALVGDYNHNGIVDAADYTVWRDSLGQTGTGLAADGNHDDQIDAGDFDVWRANFGNHSGSGSSANAAVPEPSTLLILVAGILTMCCSRRATVS